VLFNKLADQLESIFSLDVIADSENYQYTDIACTVQNLKGHNPIIGRVTLLKTFSKFIRFASSNIYPAFSFACFNPSSSIYATNSASPATTTATTTLTYG
jgi:hypothetical protein